MTTVLFCNGIPGSPRDADLLQAANPHVKIAALDLLLIGADDPDNALQGLDPDTPIHLIGFSIGAMAAIKIAAIHPQRISQLTLISPAAPLQMGNFLPCMAGKPIFDLALHGPKRLLALTWMQGFLARLCPNILIKALFSNCGRLEKVLSQDPQFQAAMRAGLMNSFAHHPAAYREHLASYVADWRDAVVRVQCPVTLWHGAQDTWSPPAMSDALQAGFTTQATVHLIPDAGHYTTLQQVVLT